MNIPKKDIDLFYKLNPALLQYVNQRLKLFPMIKTAEELRTSGIENVSLARAELWKRIDFIDEFVAENPAGFSKEECLTITGWKHAVRGKFYVLKHLKKYSIFLTVGEPAKAYGVCSLYTPFNEMFWDLPIYIEMALIPFQGHIIYDGIFYSYPVIFGAGFRFDLNEAYRKAKNKFGIIEQIVIP